MSIIAGPYVWTLGGSALGQVEDAPRLSFRNSQDRIQDDAHGDTMIDGVYRGGDAFLDLILNEYDAAAALAAFHPFADTFGKLGIVGKTSLNFAAILVGTAVSGTTATPSTITANKACLAPGQDVSLLFGSRHRNVPIRFQLLPYTESAEEVFFH
jgi:hypothetical protein